MSTSPLDGDALSCAAAIAAGAVSAIEMVNQAIERIERLDPIVHAMSWERFERARNDALSVDLSAPFAGVPILIKDLEMDMEGELATAGNAMLRASGYCAESSSPLVDRLQRAGFIILGGAMSSEFGTAAVTCPPDRPPTATPWALDRNAGGSSGGSAAAVAAGMVPVAHGSDGGGSIRIPAAFCGLVGLKPSRGRVTGAPSDPQMGPAVDHVLARSIRDSAACLDVLAGPEPGDTVIAPPPPQSFASSVDIAPRPLRIGVMASYPGGDGTVHPSIVRAVERTAHNLAALGHRVEWAYPGVMDRFDEMVDCVTVLLSTGLHMGALAMEAELGHAPGAGEMERVNRDLAANGARYTAADFAAAFGLMNDFSRDAAQWWGEGFDVLVHPVTANPAPIHHELHCREEDDGVEWFGRMCRYLAFTPTWNLTGQPALALPTGLDDGLPTSVQLVGRYGDEALLLALGRQLEIAHPWPLTAPLS